MKPFTVDVPDAVLADLLDRLGRTRWPDEVPGMGWDQGTDLSHLRSLTDYWQSGFDWRAQELWINSYPAFQAEVEGVTVHFVHVKAKHGNGIPLILTHGWPSAFIEYLPLVPLLTDPVSGPAFDLVIPSLPGYGFTPRPPRPGINYRYVATVWRSLMRSLGYTRYGAGGGDFGSGVAAVMAHDDPSAVMGIHLTNMDLTPALSLAPEPFREVNEGWAAVERGYSAIQSTKPQTVGYGLNDSPTGLAAWLVEKWHSWCGTPPSRDFLLTLVTLYWVTQSITPSLRDYYDNRWHPVDLSYVDTPTAVAVFANEHVPEGEPPREWAAQLYNIQRWNVFPEGGHFAPIEQPEAVAADIAAFFATLT